MRELWREWVAKGDASRDRGDFETAARCYRRALEHRPEDPSIAVQLGNMLKDSGQTDEATKIYRQALALGADGADTYLQLGRALRLAQRTEEAIQALLDGLALGPADAGDLTRELIELNGVWKLQQQRGLGGRSLAELVGSLNEVRRVLERIEGEIPNSSRLSALPPSQWNLWRKMWTVAAAPPSSGSIRLLVLANSAPDAATTMCLRSLHGQSPGLLSADVIVCSGGPAPMFGRMSHYEGNGPAISVRAADRTEFDELCRWVDAAHTSGDEWLALATEPLEFHRETFGWILHHAETAEHAVLTCDEDVLNFTFGDRAEKEYRHPIFRGQADPELLAQGIDLGSIVVAPGSAWKHAIGVLAGTWSEISVCSWRWLLHRELALRLPSRHIHDVLVSRIASGTDERAQWQAGKSFGMSSTVKATGMSPASSCIRVIVPTKDRIDLLDACLSTLRSRAERPDLVKVLVIDNNSECEETKAYLDACVATGEIDVIEDNAPFNWAALNNRGAASTSEPLLLFANNDIEMLTAGWDGLLRERLHDEEVGAVGIRLLYPDRTIQHAGIVTGTDGGGSEHEGRGALESNHGPGDRWRLRRSVAAVTGAFLACRRDALNAVEGFDATDFPVWFNDVDFCLALRSKGFRVVFDPMIEAIHHESKSVGPYFEERPEKRQNFDNHARKMKVKWGDFYMEDPYFNKHYARWGQPYEWLRPPGQRF